MNIKLERLVENEFGLFGKLFIDSQRFYTLEGLHNNNQENSCIPTGNYNLEEWQGEKHKNVYHLMNVPGREKILIHPGNYLRDTIGCILVGMTIGYDSSNTPYMVGHSCDAIKILWRAKAKKINITENIGTTINSINKTIL